MLYSQIIKRFVVIINLKLIDMKARCISILSLSVVFTIQFSFAQQNPPQSLEEKVTIGYGEQNSKRLVQNISVVDNDAIKDLIAISPQELLQGQVAGVQVVNSSGILGAATIINIRGASSINSGGRPLIVLDGVPLNDANLTLAQGGQSLNPLADIDPRYIESFTVLKDASAAAIYGTRGANGVILITTKSGKKNQETRVTVNTSTSWSEATDFFDMMSADQLRQFRIDNGDAPPGGDPEESFDWIPNVMRTGVAKNVDFSINGGGENTTYFVGASFSDQEGYIIGNNLNKTSARINLTHDANNWLKLGVNLGISQNKNDRVFSENAGSAPMTGAFLQTPWLEPYDENGSFVAITGATIPNILAVEALNINDSNTFRTVGNIFAELHFSDFVDGLSYRTDFGVDRIVLEEFQRSFEVTSVSGTDSFARDFYAQQNRYVFTNALNYSQLFNDVHNFTAILGVSYEQTDIRNITASGTGFLFDTLINVSSTTEDPIVRNTTTASRLAGYFARGNYTYDDKYSVEASFRRDGSSRFGVNNRYGNFWSIGAAWVLSSEDFMQDVNWLNFLKIRANYGILGNDRIGDFASSGSFQSSIFSNYNGELGLRQLSAANTNLKWETSKSYNVGFKASILNNNITLAFDYYNKKTTDLILNVPIPQTNGGLNAFPDNVGEMENKGFEVALSSINYKTPDFQWTTSLNLGFNTNEVLSLPNADLDNQGRRYVLGSTSQRAVEGYSVNSFFLIRYVGVNPDTGDAEWLDIDGNSTTTPNTDDRVIAGKADPDFVGGLRNTLKYKEFDLNFFFNFSYGNDIFVSGLRFTDNPSGLFNKRTTLLDVWENPGDNAFAPAFASATFSSAFAQRSTAQLKDGSFARLKNITLGYTLPKDLLESVGFINGVRFYVTANNLLTIKGKDLDGIDPEVTGSIQSNLQGETFFTPPQSKTYLVGARLTF